VELDLKETLLLVLVVPTQALEVEVVALMVQTMEPLGLARMAS